MTHPRDGRVERDTVVDDGYSPTQRRLWRSARLLLLAGLLLLLVGADRLSDSGVGLASIPMPAPLSIARPINAIISTVGGSRQLILVADASASMSDPPPGGDAPESKWDLVRRGVAEFLGALPDDAVVGVRVFGQSTARCAVSEQLRPPLPLGVDGAEEIAAALERVHPAGDTPLAEAIEAAADDLGEAGGEIVVLSDGMETCVSAEELCETAHLVARRGATVRIDVVTFMSEDEQRAIACVPEATGGIGVNLVRGDAGALAAVLLRMLPLQLLTAILLIASGGLTFFYGCDLLAGALGTILVRGTAGFIADIVFAVLCSVWSAFWLTRLTRFPFLLAAFLAGALVVFLYREIPRRRSAADGAALP